MSLHRAFFTVFYIQSAFYTRSAVHFSNLGPVSRNSRELFGPEKPVIKLQSDYFEKLILLTCFQNVRKTKRIAKFDDLEPRRCEDIKGIVAPEIGPKTFETFEKQATVPRFIPGPQSAVRSTSFLLTNNNNKKWREVFLAKLLLKFTILQLNLIVRQFSSGSLFSRSQFSIPPSIIMCDVHHDVFSLNTGKLL